jgi:hypothetical protein
VREIILGRQDKVGGSVRGEGNLKYFKDWNPVSYLCYILAQESDIRELIQNMIT